MCKKKAFCVLAMALFFTSSIFAYGNEDVKEQRPQAIRAEVINIERPVQTISEAKAERIVNGLIRSLFDVDITAGNFEKRVEFRSDWMNPDQFVWQFSFYRYDRFESMHLDITIDAVDGSLRNVYRHFWRDGDDNNVTRFTRDELLEKAKNLLSKVNPNLVNTVELQDSGMEFFRLYGNEGLRPTQFNYHFARTENGIPVAGNGITIGLNSGTGELVSYEINWGDIQLPSINNIISIDEARELYNEEIDFQLAYLPNQFKMFYVRGADNEVRLVYVPVVERGFMIDAETGEFIDHRGMTHEGMNTIDITPEEREEFKGLAIERQVRSKELSRDEAIALSKRILYDIYQQEATIQHTNFSTFFGNSSRSRAWNISFMLAGDEHPFGHLTIDALTEEVLSLYYYNWSFHEVKWMDGEEEMEDLIEYTEAYAKAINVLKALYPHRLNSIETKQTYFGDIRNQEYYFSFQRVENGIPYHFNAINISVNGKTGNIQSIHVNWDDVQLPKPEGLIPVEEVREKYIRDLNLRLMFTPIFSEDSWGQPSNFKLVYIATGVDKNGYFNMIDAKTGEYTGWHGRTMKEHEQRTDEFRSIIEGHPSERELRIMIESGIANLEAYDLEGVIPKKEIIKMMVLANGYWPHMAQEAGDLKFLDVDKNDEYYQYIQAAVFHGIIRNEAINLRAEEAVTREELAKMLINMVRLDRIANVKGIYTIPVKDLESINQDLLGHVAIVYGLDVLTGDGEYFHPNNEVTLLEVAISIFRMFSKFGARW